MSLMKIALYGFTGLLLLLHSCTAIIGEPSGLDYRLVLKPYPSMLKVVPGMEERAWNRAVATGEIPEWVAARRYVVIGTGSAEMKTQPWEYAYRASFPITALCLLGSLVVAFRSIRHRTAVDVVTR